MKISQIFSTGTHDKLMIRGTITYLNESIIMLVTSFHIVATKFGQVIQKKKA
jgi:hypothetical protein